MLSLQFFSVLLFLFLNGLFSNALILSSALFILLLFAFSSAFLSANEFYNFSWLLLIVSSSFLWYSTFIQFLIASVFSLSLQFI